MIKLTNITKTFKSGRNKINAIDNTTLSFEETGLVCLLGSSGCGKTTMLNVIGGLDKVSKGNIYINDKKYNSNATIDKIRNNEIGYIFQDYKLVNNLTVFENVAIVLKMLGLKNKNEIKERVLYSLSLVKMERYKNRPVKMLSGGEKQRVAIARAIIKNPQVILADEPTGNLDSKNSLEIMKIISTIAKKKLVILVTHEEKLANFYATRIIRIKDGKVTDDTVNNNTDSLEYEIENNIYLKDFKTINKVNNELYDINLYNNNEEVQVTLVVKNNNIYIKSNKKINVIDEHSNIELVDEHYKSISKNDTNFENYDEEKIKITKKKYTSIFNLKNIIVNGFKKVFKYSILKKLLMGGYFLSGMFIFFSISGVVSSYTVKEEDFMDSHRDVIEINEKLTDSNYDLLLKDDNINYILPETDIYQIEFLIGNFLQLKDNKIYKNVSISYKEDLKLTTGKLPSKDGVVIDQMLILEILELESFSMIGMVEADDFLGKTIRLNNKEYEIVGISNEKNPVLYVDDIKRVTNKSKLTNYEDEDFNLISGKLPGDYEIVVSDEFDYPLETEITIDDELYLVVGKHNGEVDTFYTNEKTIHDNNFDVTSYIVNTNDKESLKNTLDSMNIKYKDLYEIEKMAYISNNKNTTNLILFISLIILAVSSIEVFLMIRSSFQLRIKEVGIYRAIGIKKVDIYKMFTGEIIAITTLASVTGVLFMTYIFLTVKELGEIFIINGYVVLLSILFVYFFNIIIGLLPVFLTISSSPSAILSRNDVE